MLKFWLKVGIYFICFIFSMLGMNSLDYARFIKKNKTGTAALLYVLVSFALAYLVGQFLISIIYYFNI